jgi:type I restriction enzyme S subunit
MREGWELKTLNELFDVKSSKRVHKADWKDSGVPFYRAREVVKLAQNGSVDNALFISEELYNEFTKEKGAPKVGDIIISAVGTLGQCYLVKSGDKFYFKDASVLWFENISNVNTRYIEYAFKSDLVMKQVMHKSMGATVGTLTISRAKIIEIPIPPLPEQQQIVALLDQAFEAIDQAKANIEKNIENAKELFQSKLNNIFSQKGEGWEEKTLGEVVSVIGGGTPSKKVEKYYNGDIPWATVRDMNSDKLSVTDHRITELGLKESSANIIPKEHTIIATRVGLGKVCILEQDTAINQDLKGLIPKSKYDILNDFIFWWYKSIAHKVVDAGTGATVQGVKLPFVKGLTFPLTSKEEQVRVVNLLNKFSLDVENVENTYLKKLSDLDELKKSILQKAFAGELTTKTVEV